MEMNDHDLTELPNDRSKRPRLEEEVDADNEAYEDKEDRHPKRQAVPNPDTKGPHFTGEDKKDTRRRSQKWTETDLYATDDDGSIVEPGYSSDPIATETSSTTDSTSGIDNINTLKLKHPHNSIVLRSLVNSKDAGIVIGHAGKNVNEIREHSISRVTISDMVYGAYDRILTVTGSVEAAAKAYSMVCEKIMTERPFEDRDNKQETTPSIRLLVPDIRMGGLIGRNGTIIKSMQEESGAYMNASGEILAMSTERILTITGTPKSIFIAVARVGDILADLSQRPLPGYIPYTPMSVKSSMPALNRSIHSGSGNGASNVTVGGDNYGMMPTMPRMIGIELPSMPMGPPFIYQSYGGAADYRNMNSNQSQQIVIPNGMVGCIIGKNGSRINEIRQVSGSHIKIMDPSGDTNERLVTITGSYESNQMAMYMIYSQFEKSSMM